MTKNELNEFIRKGEGYQIEFKSSFDSISKDVFDTVCSFSNREGGTIILGVDNDGTIKGVNPESIQKIKKNFVTSINNINKFYPPLYFPIEDFYIEDKIVLFAHVPECNQVCRHRGRIIDRNNDSDIDITDNFELVRQLYLRKGGSYFVNTVTGLTLNDLRSDLFERARSMTRNRSLNHPWMSMSDEEILRISGLIMKDPITQKEGLTLAAILLFGKDAAIISVLPHHKTDAIVRIEDINRYDDRDVIITNLLESYDRMVAFCQKHLSNPFILEGEQSISTRDKILREICANSLVHRNYSSGFVSQLVIEKDRLMIVNPSVSYINGKLSLSSFRPFSKNPQISKVFREIGLADELGSGMGNTCKYTRLYSGGEPSFIEEGGMFRTEIPLSNVSLLKTGPEISPSNVMLIDKGHDKGHDAKLEWLNEVQKKIILFCLSPKSKKEIVTYMGFKNPRTFSSLYMKPLLEKGFLQLCIPDKPKSRYQKYISTNKGLKRF